MNPYKKFLVIRDNGVEMINRVGVIPMEVVYEPKPEVARALIKEFFPLWDLISVHHSPETMALAYTSPQSAAKIYGEHW